MRPSKLRHPVAVLRGICELRQKEFANLIGITPVYLQKIELTPAHHGVSLSAKVAQRIFHETGVSIEWLRAGNPSRKAVSSRGEPYTREIFVRAQAEKKHYDRPPIPFFLNTDALRYCARVVAILESARKSGKYYSAEWEMGAALDKLQKEYGQESGTEFTNTQVDLLRPLIEQGKNPLSAIRRLNAAPRLSKRSLKKKPRQPHRS